MNIKRIAQMMTFVVGISTGLVLAQEKRPARPGVPPRFVSVLHVEEARGEVELSSVTVRLAPEARVRKVEQNGKVEEVTETVMIPVYEERIVGRVAVTSAEVFEAGGKKLNSEEALKRIMAGAIVVISADGKSVDAAYLRLLAKDTLVIVSPELAMQGTAARGGGATFTPRRP